MASEPINNSKSTKENPRGGGSSTSTSTTSSKVINKTAGSTKHETFKEPVQKEVKHESVQQDERAQVHALFPSGLSKVAQKENLLLYDWDNSKDKDRQVRDPIRKPMALTLDDQYLDSIPPKSSKIAWEHLDTHKKKPNIEDFNDTPNPANVIVPSTKPMLNDETVTLLEVIQPEESRPPKVKPTLENREEVPKKLGTKHGKVPETKPTLVKLRKPQKKLETACRPTKPSLNQAQQHQPSSSSSAQNNIGIGIFNPEGIKFNPVCERTSRRCCTHSNSRIISGEIRRSLPWAPCAAVSKPLLLCQDCRAVFREFNLPAENLTFFEFCGYATKDEDGILTYLDTRLVEPETEESKRPKKGKCSCQKCRQKFNKVGDHFQNCGCPLCLKQLSECINKEFYEWNRTRFPKF